jgi:hypothetical protein
VRIGVDCPIQDSLVAEVALSCSSERAWKKLRQTTCTEEPLNSANTPHTRVVPPTHTVEPQRGRKTRHRETPWLGGETTYETHEQISFPSQWFFIRC